MSEEKTFGFECKNPKCRIGIIMGTCMSRPKKKGDVLTFITVKAGNVTCLKCGHTDAYDQSDLREYE